MGKILQYPLYETKYSYSLSDAYQGFTGEQLNQVYKSLKNIYISETPEPMLYIELMEKAGILVKKEIKVMRNREFNLNYKDFKWS